MHIDLSEIMSRINYTTEIDTELEADKISFGSDIFDITDKSNVKLKLKNIGKNKALICGDMTLTVNMHCGRCLKTVPVKLELMPEVEINPEGNPEDLKEMAYVSGYSFDVDGFMLDECYVQLPMNVLCSEDCKGLCIKCGKDLNEGPCDCDTFIPDPRMAKILDIYNASKEEV